MIKNLIFTRSKKIIDLLLSTLFKERKWKYFNNYFEDNWDKIENTWKGIKSILTLKILLCCC